MAASRFRALPAVNRVLAERDVALLIDVFSHEAVVAMVREELSAARESVADGDEPASLSELVGRVLSRAKETWRPWPQPVINATGVILHTNLGRSPLSEDSVQAVQDAAAGFTDLEFDLETGERGSRQARISELVCRATGAEDAIVVNNNASAVMLGLAAVATGKEVIVSRGEAVEIGGGFRIPDVLRQSGATLVEVGTTNRTYAEDYRNAITDSTGAILSVHASNFKVFGFTHQPTIPELVRVGERTGVPVLHDLGSGCLMDTSEFGLPKEPMPQDSLAAGVSLGFFSGDKLLGGPQAGVIVGKCEYVRKAASHPLARAVRTDKLSLAAFAATMLHYLRDEVTEKVPTWRMISAPATELRARAQQWVECGPGQAAVVQSTSAIGGGSLPGAFLESVALRIDCSSLGLGANEVQHRLRANDPPIVGRIDGGDVLLDPRTVLPEQDAVVSHAIQELTRAR